MRLPRITQKELASAIGVSESLISQWEKGKRTPSVKTLKKLAKAFSRLLERQITINDIIPH